MFAIRCGRLSATREGAGVAGELLQSRSRATAALEGEGGRKRVSRAVARAVTGGWRAVAVAVLAVAKRLQSNRFALGGRQKWLGWRWRSALKGEEGALGCMGCLSVVPDIL